ncbi:hypothetical protein DFH06DRAFT_1393373 [Mycena polygramma]|nr:hypothetical protein DFH06DRAFT_1393373 [Mycena polygramma]
MEMDLYGVKAQLTHHLVKERLILSPEVRKRRQIALYKAVWALSCLSTPGSSGFRIPMVWDDSLAPEARLYQHSAAAMQRWANLRAAQNLLEETSRHLMACKRAMTGNQSPDTTRVSEAVLRLHSEYNLLWFDTRFKPFPKPIELSHIETWIEELRVLPLDIYLYYLERAVESESKPYRFDFTLSLIAPKGKISPSKDSIQLVEGALQTMIDKHSRLFETAEEVHWLDQVFAKILSHFEPPALTRSVEFLDSQRSLPVFLPSALVHYLNTRRSYHPVSIVVHALPRRGWECIAGTFAPLTNVNWPVARPPVDHCLTALWRIFWVTSWPVVSSDVAIIEGILRSLCQTIVPSITPCEILDMTLLRYPDDGEFGRPHHAPGLPPWLTDSEARNTMRTALTSYLEGLFTAGDSPRVVQVVERFLAKLNTSMQEEEPSEIIDVSGEINPPTPTQYVGQNVGLDGWSIDSPRSRRQQGVKEFVLSHSELGPYSNGVFLRKRQIVPTRVRSVIGEARQTFCSPCGVRPSLIYAILFLPVSSTAQYLVASA